MSIISSSNKKSGTQPLIAEHGIEKRTLVNGTRVLLDSEPGAASSLLSISIESGIADEKDSEIGLTHLLEHMLFKRTASRGTLELAGEIDRLGGDINAFTDTESLCLHGCVPRGQLGTLFALFAEMLLESDFTQTDLDTEKEVVRQEIIEAEDDPADVVYQLFCSKFWQDSKLALPVFGTAASVASFDLVACRSRLASILKGRRLLIAGAGAVELSELMELSEQFFGDLPEGEALKHPAVRSYSGLVSKVMPVSQVHLVLGHAWPEQGSKKYLPALMATSLLGEGMSSRLFQKLREQGGLAYEVAAEHDCFRGTAALEIGAVLEAENVAPALELIRKELDALQQNGCSEEEFERACAMQKSMLCMEVDSLSNRLWRAVESELVYGDYRSAAAVYDRLEALKIEQVQELFSESFQSGDFLLALCGDVERLAETAQSWS